jgi:hypothetical protein
LGAPIDDAQFLQYARDIGGLLPLTRNQSFAVWHKEEDNYEAKEVKEEDPATRETSARRLREIGRIKTQTAADRNRKGVKSRQEIGCPRYCVSRKEVCGGNNRRGETEQCQESQEETESLTGTSCSTCCRNESPMGCKESC